MAPYFLYSALLLTELLLTVVHYIGKRVPCGTPAVIHAVSHDVNEDTNNPRGVCVAACCLEVVATSVV